jgi:tetratricopeptide (TPR) repeat protein
VTCLEVKTQILASFLFSLVAFPLQDGAWPRAVAECDRALELKPDYVKALHRRATCHQQKDDQYDQALRDWEKVRRRFHIA